MTKLSDYMKGNFDMKTFNHMPLQAIPEVYTESIKGKRFYVTPDGNKYPSITTVLSGRNAEGLIKWRERVGNDVANQIMRTAAKRGTAVHELAENYLNNANQKLKNKNCNAIILNDISNSEIGLKSDDNEVYFITKDGSEKINKNSKQIVAEKIVKKITEEFF